MREVISEPQNVVGSIKAAPRPPGRAWAATRRGGLTFLGLLVVAYAVYGRVNITFFRAENSWVAMYAQQGWPGFRELLHFAGTTSYFGHYVPLFFLVELVSTVICGIHESLWRVHQMAALVVLMWGLLSLFGQVTAGLTESRVARFSLQAGLAAPFVFSPLMIDFVSWPFEAGQILWAGLTAFSLSWFTRAIARGENGEVSIPALGISLACGYGSMHLLGLGATTMAGWCAVWAVLFLDALLGRARGVYLRRLAIVGGIGIGLTAIHGGIMVLWLPKAAPVVAAHVKPALHSHVAQTLGYTSCLFFDSLRSLWSPNGWPYPKTDYFGKDWAYGLGSFLGFAACAVGWFVAQRRHPSAAGLTRVCWQVFSLAAFTLYVLMVSLRVRRGEGGDWLSYIIGPRYLWPCALLLIGFFASYASCLRVGNPALAAWAGGLVAGTCILGNFVYQPAAAKIWPDGSLRQEAGWQQIAAMAGELERAGLPLPNLELHKLSPEFHLSLARFEPMLRSLAKLDARAPIQWLGLEEISPELWRQMKEKSPALTRLSKSMFADEDAAVQQTEAAPPEDTSGLSLASPEALKDTTLDHVKDHPNLGVDIALRGVTRRSVWIDPPTALTYRQLRLGSHPALHVFVAIHPSLYAGGGGDGAAFLVDVRVDGHTDRVGGMYLNPFAHPEQRRWTPLGVDLSKYAGKTVDLILSNDPGPAHNDYADWCIWGDPRLTE